ncbi:Ig-like domain-containing protein [Proteus hauseri]|uniref:Ig-like domain-containing protein n=1 Tax=Proteus hauseri TaxID=183417 RepID=UPI0032DB0C04
MSIIITITITSGANANGIDRNSANIILKNEDSLLDNKKVFFEVSGNAIFADTGSNQTSAITNALGKSVVYLTDTVSEIVIITAVYSEDHSVKASGSSSFGDSENNNIYPPKIDEAVNNIINLSGINNVAHIRIPKWEGMKINDDLDIYAESVFPWKINYILKSADVGNDIVLEISKSEYLEPYQNDILHLYYILNLEVTSESVDYLVISALINDIEIIGNRGNIGSAHSLVAINKKTMTPSSISWQYDNDKKIHKSSYFTDHHPLKRINAFINSNEERITVVPKNIDSLGYENKSIAYILNDKGNLFFWGSSSPDWLQPPASVTSLMSIDGIISSPYACVALTKEKKLYGWGSKGNGALDVPLNNILTIGYTRTAFSAITEELKIVAWGVPSAGGVISNEISAINGFIQVVGTRSAFCALHHSGKIYAWGSENFGGKIPNTISTLSNIKEIFATDGAFAILTEDGNVKAWGHQDFGGSLPVSLNNVKTISSNTGAFTALNNSGQVYSWGQPYNGGILPNNIQQINNIVAISSSDAAFCILLKNGTIHAWGSNDFGGKIPLEILNINNFISISSSTGGFSAISKIGTVVMWSNSDFKIHEHSTVKVKAGYRITRGSPPNTFINIFNNGMLDIIGDTSDVSNINDIPEEVYGNVNHSYLNINRMLYVNSEFELYSYIIKNNAVANGLDSNIISIIVKNAINKEPVHDVKLIMSVDGDALFLENNSIFLSKKTDLNGEINISIVNSSVQHINVVAFLNSDKNTSLHDVMTFI